MSLGHLGLRSPKVSTGLFLWIHCLLFLGPWPRTVADDGRSLPWKDPILGLLTGRGLQLDLFVYYNGDRSWAADSRSVPTGSKDFQGNPLG